MKTYVGALYDYVGPLGSHLRPGDRVRVESLSPVSRVVFVWYADERLPRGVAGISCRVKNLEENG